MSGEFFLVWDVGGRENRTKNGKAVQRPSARREPPREALPSACAPRAWAGRRPAAQGADEEHASRELAAHRARTDRPMPCRITTRRGSNVRRARPVALLCYFFRVILGENYS